MGIRAIIVERDSEGRTQAGLREIAESDLPDGEVTVAVEFSTLNYKDGLCLGPGAGLVRKYPHVPGVDFAGLVEASSDPRYRPGDPVVLTGWRVGEAHWGGYAQKVRVKADWLVHPQHLVSVGINAWEMTGNPDRRMAAPPAFSLFSANNPFQDGKISALGAYVQDDIRLGKLNVLAGVRHDTVKGDADSMSNGMRKTGLANEEGALSGNLGAIVEIAPLLRPYANYARAFRAPGMRERYESGLRGDGYFYAGNPKVEAEKADELELGLKGASDKLSYQVAAYHHRIDNYITGQIITGAAAGAMADQVRIEAEPEGLNLFLHIQRSQ